MKLSKKIAQLLRELQVLSNRNRLAILCILYNAEVLDIAASLTFTHLKRVVDISSNELSYHLKLLKLVKFTSKRKQRNKKTVRYSIRPRARVVLNQMGINKKVVKNFAKEIRLI